METQLQMRSLLHNVVALMMRIEQSGGSAGFDE